MAKKLEESEAKWKIQLAGGKKLFSGLSNTLDCTGVLWLMLPLYVEISIEHAGGSRHVELSNYKCLSSMELKIISSCSFSKQPVFVSFNPYRRHRGLRSSMISEAWGCKKTWLCCQVRDTDAHLEQEERGALNWSGLKATARLPCAHKRGENREHSFSSGLIAVGEKD